ncbi:hypothetical protein C8Q80DRAFT_1114756 [Daedaleopsis nitida]|nr:hypothetical protein C8Q80DRAFT_1114756 [Daedaleopsis nitida]
MLPGGSARWKVQLFETIGDELDEDGCPKKETAELWMRDPVECVRELIGNPLFRENMCYAPKRVFADSEGNVRIYDNMWTANWWWDTQLSLPVGATIAPVILASDKTTLSRMSGDKSAWPVYLTIGNIDKGTRRKPSMHATVLLGYLPVSKLECFSEKRRSLEVYRLFHKCMHALLEPLIAAGTHGIDMVCSDGFVRRVYPILAAYVADHPEQCLIAGCQENFCPKCQIDPKKRREPGYYHLRDPTQTVSILDCAAQGDRSPEFARLGLRPIDPFWKHLPHCNIFLAITPDILHQLHKGIFKDHLVSWATKSVEGGKEEFDRRFKAMPKQSGLRHFKNGISKVSQWTGTEHKNMERVFMGVVAGAGEGDVTWTVRAVLDFVHYAHFEKHTDLSLNNLHSSWLGYHRYKLVFRRLGVRRHFNFPKGHSTEHYEPSIRALGTADGYSTEHPERLHIDLAKDAYRASNKQETYLQQMTLWLERQEALYRFSSFLLWSAPCRAAQDRTSREDHPADVENSDSSEDERLGEPALKDLYPRGYRVAKVPSFPLLTVSDFIRRFGLPSDFIYLLSSAVATLAKSASSTHQLPIIHNRTRLGAYKQMKIPLPVVPQITQEQTIDIIHASPSRPGRFGSTIPSYMSTVLVHDSGSRSGSSRFANQPRHPLHGLRVARVRAIFNLPVECNPIALGVRDPLVYVEWFTRFHSVDEATGMYIISHSTRNQRRQSAIIPITDIVRTVHLMPYAGRRVDRTWTSSTVLDRCTKFFVNPYLRHDDFVLFRYQIDRIA